MDTALLLASLLAVSPAQAPATADALAVVAIPRPGAPASSAIRAEQVLGAALDSAGTRRVVVEAAIPPVPASTVGASALRAAEEAMDNLEPDVASRKLDEAEAAFQRAPSSADARSLARLHLLRAALALSSGKQGARRAQDALARALLFQPGLTLDSRLFPAEAKRLLDKARADVEGRPRAALQVTVSPAGAQVRVQDVPVGRSPLSEPLTLPVGPHLISATLPGHQPQARLVEVTRPAPDVALALEPIPEVAALRRKAEALLPGGPGSPTSEAARALAASLQVRFLVLVLADEAAADIQVWDTAQGGVLRGLTMSGSRESAAPAARAVKDFVASPSKVAAAVPAMAPAAPGAEVWTQPWFWAVVGGVVAAGAATGVVIWAVDRPRPYNPVLSLP